MLPMARRDAPEASWFNYWAIFLGQNRENGWPARASKKIEQAASAGCQKSEYLTLLNTFENATTRDRRSSSEPYLE
jgi:hypothetical protein